jgi:ribose/xylose/arabinose/galactoside ABC-type transport system permease subunit
MKNIVKFVREQKILFIIIILFIVITFINKAFFTYNNIWGWLIEIPPYGFAALGLTVSLICGLLNISMGSLIALSGVTYALFLPGMGVLGALVVSMLFCIAIGCIGAFCSANLKIDPFVVTLALMIVTKGIALALTNQAPVIITDRFTISLGEVSFGPIPLMFIIFLICTLILEFILKYTVFGRNLYIIGGNKDIAKSVGIKVIKNQYLAFIIYSFLACIGGFFLSVRMNAGSPIVGDDAPLAIIPMVIIGGTALSGGKGGAVKTFLGVILLTLVFNIMNLFGLKLNYQYLIKGLILLVMVVWDNYIKKRDKKI